MEGNIQVTSNHLASVDMFMLQEFFSKKLDFNSAEYRHRKVAK
jgi:hypothetical protein